MIAAKIDRCRENDRPAAGGLREGGEKIVSGNDRGAMLHGPQKFLEIFAAQGSTMFLIAKHHCIIEIEHNPPIGAPEQAKLEFVEADSLEENDHIVPARLSQNTKPFAYTRTPRWNHGRVKSEGCVIIETISQ